MGLAVTQALRVQHHTSLLCAASECGNRGSHSGKFLVLQGQGRTILL
jgi:hypothetical protein